MAVPAHDLVAAGFCQDLAELYAYTREQHPGVTVQLAMQAGTYVHSNRERLLSELTRWGATHVLWLDADMRFPRDTFCRLLARNRAFVACNCATRYTPSRYTAVRGGQVVPTTSESRGLEAVDSVGLAVMLTQTDALKDHERPLFAHPWSDAAQQTVGEDVFFCQQVRRMGHTIYIDHDLSPQIGHVGPFTYRLQDIPAPVAVLA